MAKARLRKALHLMSHGARELYAGGHIDHDRFEKLVERELLIHERSQGRSLVPDGWEALPPCDHLFSIEITMLGDWFPRQICGHCGVQRIEALEGQS